MILCFRCLLGYSSGFVLPSTALGVKRRCVVLFVSFCRGLETIGQEVGQSARHQPSGLGSQCLFGEGGKWKGAYKLSTQTRGPKFPMSSSPPSTTCRCNRFPFSGVPSFLVSTSKQFGFVGGQTRLAKSLPGAQVKMIRANAFRTQLHKDRAGAWCIFFLNTAMGSIRPFGAREVGLQMSIPGPETLPELRRFWRPGQCETRRPSHQPRTDKQRTDEHKLNKVKATETTGRLVSGRDAARLYTWEQYFGHVFQFWTQRTVKRVLQCSANKTGG